MAKITHLTDQNTKTVGGQSLLGVGDVFLTWQNTLNWLDGGETYTDTRPWDYKITSIDNSGSLTLTIEVNGSPYSLGDTINAGDILEITSIGTGVITLHIENVNVYKAGYEYHIIKTGGTNNGGKEWQLQFFNQTDIIQLEATANNIATFTSGVGTDVGTIDVSTDGVSYSPLAFPFSPSVGTLYFKRSINLVTGVYTISE